jgi:hypothetical protein
MLCRCLCVSAPVLLGACASSNLNFDPPGSFNPLNAELNPICHLLELLGSHRILHVSRMRVKRTLAEECLRS